MSLILNTIRYTRRIKTHLYTLLLRSSFAAFGQRSLLEHRAATLNGLKRVYVGSRTVFGPGVKLTTWGEGRITVGDDCHFGDSNHLTAMLDITIGNNLLTGSNVLFSDNLHGTNSLSDLQQPPIERQLYCKGKICIANNVWIGNNVCILSGVRIGEGAIIGANSVVTHDVPAYSVAAGTPARIIHTAK